MQEVLAGSGSSRLRLLQAQAPPGSGSPLKAQFRLKKLGLVPPLARWLASVFSPVPNFLFRYYVLSVSLSRASLGFDVSVLSAFPLFDPALHLGCQSCVHSTSLGLKKSRKTHGASPRRREF